MKRIIDKYDHRFIKDGKRIFCTFIDVPITELPEDCDFKGLDVTIINVLYDDCRIRIRGFDKNQNALFITIPDYLKFFLYKAARQGQDNCIQLLTKMSYETEGIKFNRPIGYDNTIVLSQTQEYFQKIMKKKELLPLLMGIDPGLDRFISLELKAEK